jgi:nitrite reductase (NADH) small subunit
MPEFVTVAKISDLAPGEGRLVQAGGRDIALFNVEGTFFAIDNNCKHRGGPLSEGDVEGHVVTCPWHGWRWNLMTGRSEHNPQMGVPCFETRVNGDEVQVAV